MSDKLTAYLSVGSTYSFLTALRLRDLIEQHSIDLTIVPISIRSIMKEMNNIPFPPEKAAKVNYMWRDIERRAELYGLPKLKAPVPYPLKEFDRANLVGVVLNARGLFLNYFEATYRAWFLDGIEAGSDENLRQSMGVLGLDWVEIREKAFSEEIRLIYEANTNRARDLGIFGVPSFIVENEIFWGDDRLEDAIAFSSRHL